MHIVMLLSNAFLPDPRVLKESESLAEAGFEITILCWDRLAERPLNEQLQSGVKIVRVQTVRSSYGIGARQILSLLKFWRISLQILGKLRPDALHCHDFDTLPPGFWYSKLHHIPLIYDAHEYYAELVKPRLKGIWGLLIYKIISVIEQIGAHSSNAIVTVDEKLASKYNKINHNVIILGHYPPRKMALNSNKIFSREYLSLIYAGRLSIDRGILVYVDIIRKLLVSGIPVKLILAGSFIPESDKLIFNAYAKELVNHINFVGWIPYNEISKYYLNADIGLAILLPEPRYVNAVPVKLFEYMAHGLPVVASNFPLTANIVKLVNCGLLINPLDEITEINKTVAFWWENKAIPQMLGENGRQAILTKYNWENQVSRLILLYRNIT